MMKIPDYAQRIVREHISTALGALSSDPWEALEELELALGALEIAAKKLPELSLVRREQT